MLTIPKIRNPQSAIRNQRVQGSGSVSKTAGSM